MLSDALQNEGDPRGLLMALELQADTQESAELQDARDALLMEHGDLVLGPLLEHRRPHAWATKWGVLRHLGVRGDANTLPLLQALHDGGHAETLTSLRILDLDVASEVLEWVIATLGGLRVLQVGPIGLGGMPLSCSAPHLFEALPLLERARLPPMQDFDAVRHSRLETLAFVPRAHHLANLTRERFPRLSHLSLGPRASWSPAALRRLRELRLQSLRGGSDFRRVWARLEASPRAESIEWTSPDEAVSTDPIMSWDPDRCWWTFTHPESDHSHRVRRLGRRLRRVQGADDSSIVLPSEEVAIQAHRQIVESWRRDGWR